MKVAYIPHQNISKDTLLDVVKIKSIAWPYTTNEQLEWINKNIKNEDIHVLLTNDKNDILAYLNLVEIELEIDDVTCKAFGIGNVCAATKGSGYGSKLFSEVNKFLLFKNRKGLLFCNRKLVSFYERLGWKIISKKEIDIKGIGSNTCTLIFNCGDGISKLIYRGVLF